jgi:hypothetical protein
MCAVLCDEQSGAQAGGGRPRSPEAVAQRSRWSASATGGGCGVADGSVLIGGVTMGGPVSGPVGGDLVMVELGEVVGCHQ